MSPIPCTDCGNTEPAPLINGVARGPSHIGGGVWLCWKCLAPADGGPPRRKNSPVVVQRAPGSKYARGSCLIWGGVVGGTAANCSVRVGLGSPDQWCAACRPTYPPIPAKDMPNCPKTQVVGDWHIVHCLSFAGHDGECAWSSRLEQPTHECGQWVVINDGPRQNCARPFCHPGICKPADGGNGVMPPAPGLHVGGRLEPIVVPVKSKDLILRQPFGAPAPVTKTVDLERRITAEKLLCLAAEAFTSAHGSLTIADAKAGLFAAAKLYAKEEAPHDDHQ